MIKIKNSSQYKNMISSLVAETGLAQEEVMESAAKYLKELYTEHVPSTTILATEASQYLLSRGYDKTIDVNIEEIKNLGKIARKQSIAFVLTHKTYIDTLVLSIVLARYGLPMAYTFGGINMSFLGIGQIGRKAGVIFIRRSFKDNTIYKAVLRFFIAHLVNQNSSFMWAIEGTRSRTGKLVWPKMGILKYIMEAEQDTKKDVAYIPVSIVYDLIPDVHEMTQEVRGKSKKPESLMWFVNYMKNLGGNLGKISIRFGDPVHQDSHSIEYTNISKTPNALESESVSGFALDIVHKINNATPVTTTSLVCISLLSKYALTKRAIESNIADLMHLVESHKADALVDRGKSIGESVQHAINMLLGAEILIKHGDGLRTKYAIRSENFLSAVYYCNMAVHHFYLRAFIELALLKTNEKKAEGRTLTFWQDIMELRNLFKFEFFYSPKPVFTTEIENDLNIMWEDWRNSLNDPNMDLTQVLIQQKMFVAPVVLYSYVEAYMVVLHALKDWDAHDEFEEESFVEFCLFHGGEMHWQGKIQRIESVSKPLLKNGIRFAKNLNIIPTLEDDKWKEIDKYLIFCEDVVDRLKVLQEMTLSHSTDNNNSIVPFERDVVPGSKVENLTRDIAESEKGSHIAAFFDLDRTLIKGFSAKEFFQARLLSGKMSGREIIAQFSGVLVYASGNANFAGLAAIGAQGVKGINEKVFIEVGEEVYLKHLAESIYPESRALVAAHMAQGHTVAIVSAATPYQVNPIAKDLGIDHVMCTKMEVIDGKFTGKIIEPACWGEGKAYAGRTFAEEHNIDLGKSFFYTDSAEDLPLMDIVGNPRPVNPDNKLTAQAFLHDWPVLRFDEDSPSTWSNVLRTGLAMGSLWPATVAAIGQGALNMSWKDGVNSLISNLGDIGSSMAGLRLAVKGEEFLTSHRPAVFIFNHQSGADMFIMSKLIRKDATAIAKAELKSYPILGQVLSAAGVIFIDRKDKEKAIEALKPAVEALKSGTSIAIAPEGTRSVSYNLGAFKKGAFHLAMQSKVPIVPIVIKNAHDAMPKGSNLLKPTLIEVVVLEPIATDKWTLKNMDTNIKKVRNLYLKELGQREEPS